MPKLSKLNIHDTICELINEYKSLGFVIGLGLLSILWHLRHWIGGADCGTEFYAEFLDLSLNSLSYTHKLDPCNHCILAMIARDGLTLLLRIGRKWITLKQAHNGPSSHDPRDGQTLPVLNYWTPLYLLSSSSFFHFEKVVFFHAKLNIVIYVTYMLA